MLDRGARMAIESLRSGVPSRNVVKELGTTQREIEQTFDDQLNKMGAGEPTDPLIVSASFGQGKSHLLNYLRERARETGYVTSLVVISPEAPLGNAHVILKAMAENAEAPEHTGVALRCLAASTKASTESFAALRWWASHDRNICDRFRAMLHLYDEFSIEPELRMQIVRDFEGQPMLKTLIKQKLKEINQTAAYDLRHPRNALLAHQRIRIYARFAVACGVKGVVIFFDELERLAMFPRKQRIAAYSELGWWRRVAGSRESYILPVFAANISQIQQSLEEDAPYLDYGAPPAAGLFEEPAGNLAREGMELLRESIPLRAIDDQDREDLKFRVREIYARAYNVQPSDPPSSSTATTVRADIRRWITYWDLERLYGRQERDLEYSEVDLTQREISPDLLAVGDSADDEETDDSN